MDNLYYALEMTLNDWQILFAEWGEQKFRASQVCEWIYSKKEFSFHAMTNLSKALREKLNDNVIMSLPVMIRQQVSKDGTKKYLWNLKVSKVFNSRCDS